MKDRNRLVVTYPKSKSETAAYAMAIERSTRFSAVYNQITEMADGDTINLSYIGRDGLSEDVSDPGQRILKINDSKYPYLAYHLGIAVTDQNDDPLEDVKVWFGVDQSEPEQGYESSTAIGVGSNYGFEWSQHTVHGQPFDTGTQKELIPSNAIEVIKWSGTALYLGLENNTGGIVTPKLHMYGKAYDVAVLNRYDMEMAKKALLGDIPATVKSIGRLRDYSLSPPDEWKGPVVVKKKDMAVQDTGE